MIKSRDSNTISRYKFELYIYDLSVKVQSAYLTGKGLLLHMLEFYRISKTYDDVSCFYVTLTLGTQNIIICYWLYSAFIYFPTNIRYKNADFMGILQIVGKVETTDNGSKILDIELTYIW